MVKYKNLNNVSDKLLEEIPKLENGQEVVFQMLNGHVNNDPDVNARQSQPMLYGKTQIPTKSRIKDPYTNNIVDIGVPMAVENGEVKSFRPFLAGLEDQIFTGKFSLFGGRVQDEEFYEVFWLLNENESNPHRDKSVPPLFKIINPKEESKKAIGKVAVLKQALEKLTDLKDEQYNEISASQNWAGDLDSMKAKVSEWAKSYPDKFLAAVDSPDTKVKATIKSAIDKNVLGIDLATNKVTLGENELFTMSKESKTDVLQSITNWINTARNGKEVYEGIVKQLAAK